MEQRLYLAIIFGIFSLCPCGAGNTLTRSLKSRPILALPSTGQDRLEVRQRSQVGGNRNVGLFLSDNSISENNRHRSSARAEKEEEEEKEDGGGGGRNKEILLAVLLPILGSCFLCGALRFWQLYIKDYFIKPVIVRSAPHIHRSAVSLHAVRRQGLTCVRNSR
eukprot:2235848-Rhodomonas_salina.1